MMQCFLSYQEDTRKSVLAMLYADWYTHIALILNKRSKGQAVFFSTHVNTLESASLSVLSGLLTIGAV